MTDMPMTGPDQWGKGKPKNLQEAVASVQASLTLVDQTIGKLKGPTADHVATIRDAAEGLLSVLDRRSSGQVVRARVVQFNDGTRASVAAVNAQLGRGVMSLGPAGALLASVADLDALAQNL